MEKNRLRKLSKNLVANPDDYIVSLRKNLFMYVSQKDISLAEIAEEADLPLSTLRSFLYGDSTDVKVSTVVKLAKALNVSIDELLGSGTISPQTCESLQITRQLPESFTHFVRWCIHYHYDKLNSEQVTEKAIEVMMAECGDNGNLKMTNNFHIFDISDLNDDMRPKIFMGIHIPCEHYLPEYYPNDVLLIANDRNPRPTERVVVNVGDNMWILTRKDERVNGQKAINYYSIRDGRLCATDKDIKLTIGYVVKVIHDVTFED